jgi:WD40 repeat protein
MDGSAFHFMLETGGHTALIRQVYFTPDATQIISGSEDKTARIWDLASSKLVNTLRGEVGPGFQGSLNALAVSSDGAFIATGGYFLHEAEGLCSFCGDVRLFERRNGALLAVLRISAPSPAQQPKSVTSLAFSKSGALLLSSYNNGMAVIWDVAKRAPSHFLTHPSTVYAARFAQDDKQVVTGDEEGKIRLWNVSDGGLVAEKTAHPGGITAISVYPPDGRIYTGGLDRTIKVWSADLLNQNRVISTERSSIVNLAISAEQKLLVASTGQAGEGYIGDPYEIDYKVRIKVFDLQDGSTAEYLGHQYDDIIPGLAFATKSGLIATGGGSITKFTCLILTGLRAERPTRGCSILKY